MDQEELQFTVSAPGKVILMGEHSVVYKKRGIASSINKRTQLNFCEHKEAHEQIILNLKGVLDQTEWDFKSIYDLISLDKPLLCDMNEFSLDNPEFLDHDKYVDLIKDLISQKISEEGPKHKAALAVFYAILGMLWCTDIDISPFDIESSTSLFIGSGTGSSASFSVCVAAAVYNYIRLKAAQKFGYGEHNVSNVSFKPHYINLNQRYSDFTLKDKEVINKWAFCMEKINHTTPSGIDNTVCCFGNSVLLNAICDSNEKNNMKLLDDLPSFRVLLVNTGVSRATAPLTKKISDLYKMCPESVQSVLDSMDVIAGQFLEYSQIIKTSSSKETNLQIYKQLEVLIDLQHGHLRTLGVSHPRLEEICFITNRRGLHSKLTGAGGGGYAFTLIPPDTPEACIKETVLDLKGSGFLVDDIILNGEGLTLDCK